MAELTLILNFIIIFLLVVAIMYGFVLNKRVKLIRESGRELSHLFRSFDNTILTAQKSVDELKMVSGEISDSLQKKIDIAALMVDDLQFLNEKTLEITNKANSVLVNLKKNENLLPRMEGRDNIAPMPVFANNGRQNEVYASEQKNINKALGHLIEEVSAIRQKSPAGNTVVNNNFKAQERQQDNQKIENKDESDDKKRQFSIASALKAMGYGD